MEYIHMDSVHFIYFLPFFALMCLALIWCTLGLNRVADVCCDKLTGTLTLIPNLLWINIFVEYERSKTIEDTGDEDEDHEYGINPKDSLYPAGSTFINSLINFNKTILIFYFYSHQYFKALLLRMKVYKFHQLQNDTCAWRLFIN